MQDTVVILGQMRSGTSAVAEIVHTLGIPVATAMHAPVPPTYRPDWEDIELSMALSRWVLGRWTPASGWSAWLGSYLKDRRQHALRCFGETRIAVKSPLLALVWDHFVQAAGPVNVLRTTRIRTGIELSLSRMFADRSLEHAASINARIAAALVVIKCDQLIDYDHLISSAGQTVAHIAAGLGIDNEDRIADAVERVKEPTSWVPA